MDSSSKNRSNPAWSAPVMAAVRSSRVEARSVTRSRTYHCYFVVWQNKRYRDSSAIEKKFSFKKSNEFILLFRFEF